MRARKYLPIWVFITSLLFISSSWAARPQPMQFHKQVVVDQQGFGMEAFRLLIPNQWRFQGGVSWDLRKFPAEAVIAFKVHGTDGLSLLEHFPHQSCFWSQDPNLRASYAQMGAEILTPMNAADYLRNVFLPRQRPGIGDLKVIESGPLPELGGQTKQIMAYHMGIFNQISPFTFQFELNADAAHLRVQYSQQGRAVVEELTATISYMTAYFPGMSGPVTAISWMPQVKSFKAPAQAMAAMAPLFKVMIDTYQENPAWALAGTRLSATITRNQLRHQQAIFDQMQQIRRTQQEVSDMIVEGYQRRSAAQDRIFDKYSEALRGVDSYRDPVNNWEVQLPTGMRNAWTNGSDYVFNESSDFNPNIGSNQNWERLERRP